MPRDGNTSSGLRRQGRVLIRVGSSGNHDVVLGGSAERRGAVVLWHPGDGAGLGSLRSSALICGGAHDEDELGEERGEVVPGASRRSTRGYACCNAVFLRDQGNALSFLIRAFCCGTPAYSARRRAEYAVPETQTFPIVGPVQNFAGNCATMPSVSMSAIWSMCRCASLNLAIAAFQCPARTSLA